MTWSIRLYSNSGVVPNYVEDFMLNRQIDRFVNTTHESNVDA